jgi:hypothetical protein
VMRGRGERKNFNVHVPHSFDQRHPQHLPDVIRNLHSLLSEPATGHWSRRKMRVRNVAFPVDDDWMSVSGDGHTFPGNVDSVDLDHLRTFSRISSLALVELWSGSGECGSVT